MLGLLVARNRTHARELSKEVDGRVVDLNGSPDKLNYVSQVIDKEVERLSLGFPEDALEYHQTLLNTKQSLLSSWYHHRWFVEFDLDIGENKYLLKQFHLSGNTLKLEAISHISSSRSSNQTSNRLSAEEITENISLGLTSTEHRAYPYTIRGVISDVVPTPSSITTGVIVDFKYFLDDGMGNPTNILSYQNHKFFKNILILKP